MATNLNQHINSIPDAATRQAVRGLVQDLLEEIKTLGDRLNSNVTLMNVHTHAGDGAQAGAYFTSPPRTNAATVTAGAVSTALTFTPVKVV